MTPWMTRRDAALLLHVSCDTIDRRLTPMEDGYVPGKFRFCRVENVRRILILAEDVDRVAPLPVDGVNDSKIIQIA